jgi:hypothetical protein
LIIFPADITEVALAVPARHVVAALIALNVHVAIGALLPSFLPNRFFEQFLGIGIQHSPLFQLLPLLCVAEELLNLFFAAVRRMPWSEVSSCWRCWGGGCCVKCRMVKDTTVDTIRDVTRLAGKGERTGGVQSIREDIVAVLRGTSQHAAPLDLILDESVFSELTVLLVGIAVLELLRAASDDGVVDWYPTFGQRTDHHIVIYFMRVDLGTNIAADGFFTKSMTTLQSVGPMDRVVVHTDLAIEGDTCLILLLQLLGKLLSFKKITFFSFFT